ncbi:endonuclease/exonuclease/phosphatase family protein [Gangjinia marincola]|uniref:Endonuclease/exonuclease/phosphatase family protein n=1 Tax=Gangjinia marincola TaxID=578463 RepID=A0ABN1MDB2_9FLAO
MKLRSVLYIFGLIVIAFTLFPLIPASHWSIRAFDFPQLQITGLTLLALILFFLRFDISKKKDIVFVAALGACFIYQGTRIFPYTPLAAFETLPSSKNDAPSLRIYTANVLQKNSDYSTLIDQINALKPDLVVLTETNKVWLEKVQPHVTEYLYREEIPMDNTYGMLLYSKKKLIDSSVKFLIEDTIPSIHTKLLITPQDTIQLYAIHPAPPLPFHNPLSVDRDAEMMKVAKLANKSPLPVITLGDFNDVAWSETTELFQEVSGLLDMRIGRGLYNTYDADNFLFRWPLDHIFTSASFRAKKMSREEHIGSDHFPLYVELTYEPEAKATQEKKRPTKKETEQAQEQLKEENKADQQGN